MSTPRRWHNQPPRDDFVIHDELGVATLRTDHNDGTATYTVHDAVAGHLGLYLATEQAIVRHGGVFELHTPTGTSRHDDLASAVEAAADHLHRVLDAIAA